MKYAIEIEKVNIPLAEGVLTHVGKIMDKLLSNNPLYYITQYPEKFTKGIPCGLWKDGRELQPIKILLVSNSNVIEADSTNDVKFLDKWLRGIREIELGKDFVIDNQKIIVLDYEQC